MKNILIVGISLSAYTAFAIFMVMLVGDITHNTADMYRLPLMFLILGILWTVGFAIMDLLL